MGSPHDVAPRDAPLLNDRQQRRGSSGTHDLQPTSAALSLSRRPRTPRLRSGSSRSGTFSEICRIHRFRQRSVARCYRSLQVAPGISSNLQRIHHG